MVALQPAGEKSLNSYLLKDIEQVKHIISGIRSIRLDKNIPNKEELTLEIVGDYNDSFNNVISKMCNLSIISLVSEKQAGAAGFLVGTTEYSIPLQDNIDVEAELKKLETELKYTEGFLNSVLKKLSNERFVQNAKPEIVEIERIKQADAERKIALLKENIVTLKKE
jgi:valyl-tRNA synthetase